MIQKSMFSINQNEFSEAYGVDEYDALAETIVEEKDPEELAETFGYIGNPELLAPKSEVEPLVALTPQERIEELFAHMKPFNRHFLRILEYCNEPKMTQDIEALIKELQAERRAVYTAASYCQMLEAAGALAKITAEGILFSEVMSEPVRVERNGQVFLEPGASPEAFWKTTQEGARCLEETNELTELQNIFERYARYTGVFTQILELCTADEGVSINEIKAVVNNNPVLERPAKTAQFFMEYLDQNGALVWDKNWKTTSLGRQALELLRA